MKAAAQAAFPDYGGGFTLAMISGKPLETFVWPGVNWTVGLVLQRLLWLAVAVGVALLGRLILGEPLALLPWALSVLFIPTLALALGAWSRSSKLFEVVYPILWYLGPFNPESGLAVIDYLGVHAQAPVNTAPGVFAGVIVALLALAVIGRRRQVNV